MFWFRTAHPETGEALEVAAVYIPPRRGARDGYGVPLEPDDAEEVRVCEVRRHGGEVVDFSAFQEALEAQAWRCATEPDP
ncbi:MAG: hypothetical protein PHQ12_06745 [Chthoniobacteraceae bacterium]|nr:hypothetical protein [Chthoniobacteraceae bacterium]